LPKPAGEYRLVSKYEMVFDGTRQEFLVYYTHRFGVAGKVIR
jgi:hypothetical protein